MCILSCVVATLHGYNVRFVNHTNRKMQAHINQVQDPAGWLCSSGHTHDIDAGGSWEKDYGGCCINYFKVTDDGDSKVVASYGRKFDLRGKTASHEISPTCGYGGDLHIWYDAAFNLKLTSESQTPDSNEIPDEVQG